MKITKITAQVKRSNAYSVFIDDTYSFSLSSESLLSAHLIPGQELTEAEISLLKQQSDDDKAYSRALNYAVLRPRSVWEMKSYLKRKKSPAPLIEQITNKLQSVELLDDRKFATAYIHDRLAFRPTSRRKITVELRQKRVSEVIIREVFEQEGATDSTALSIVIAQKRRQTRYQDDLKLMQYLSRQGFGYQEIKAALGHSDSDLN